jgi:hypothetical protein
MRSSSSTRTGREHTASQHDERFVARDFVRLTPRERRLTQIGQGVATRVILNHRDRLSFSRNCHRKELFIAVAEDACSLAQLKEQSWTDFGSRNVIASYGVVHLSGVVS